LPNKNDEVDRAGITAFRDVTSLHPALPLIFPFGFRNHRSAARAGTYVGSADKAWQKTGGSVTNHSPGRVGPRRQLTYGRRTAMNELLGNFWFLVFASITTVAGIIAHAWQKIRTAEAEARLKQAMLERGLSVDEMERLLQPQSPAPKCLLSDEELVKALAKHVAGRSEETIKRVMGTFNASDPPSKRLLCHAILGLFDYEFPSDEKILAVVRGFCRLDGDEVGIWQNSEPKLAQPATGTGAKSGAQAIRAEPLYSLESQGGAPRTLTE
jgi:hypothetical protein